MNEQAFEAAVTSNEHSVHSSYREMLLEHLLTGEIMRHLWLQGVRRMEMLKPQVDDGGYDLVAEVDSAVRHIQLKATFRGSTIRRFNINTALSAKPSGCVVVVQFNPDTLELGPFRWFGAEPGAPLPSLDAYQIARHTKGNAQGVKSPRPNIRVLPWSAFEEVSDIDSWCNDCSVIARLSSALPASPLSDYAKQQSIRGGTHGSQAAESAAGRSSAVDRRRMS